MSGLLKKLVAAVLLPSAIVAASLFPSNRSSDSVNSKNVAYESEVCDQSKSDSALKKLFEDPNGVCEEKQEEPVECIPPLASTYLRRDPRFVINLLQKCPLQAPNILTEIWIKEYKSGSHADVVSTTLFRVARTGELAEAVKGFQEGLKEREREKGSLPPKVHEELLLLSFLPIPESKWSYNYSPKKAAGPYQFTKDTATRYGLIKEYRDEEGKLRGMKDLRFKNYNSAKAAAHLLYDLYTAFKGDMFLTVSAYNSGLPWRYLSSSAKRDTLSYTDYLRFLAQYGSERPNTLRDIIENVNYVPKVKAVLKIIKEDHPEFVKFALGKITYNQLKKETSKALDRKISLRQQKTKKMVQ